MVLDPGHGGIDSGASNSGIRESDVTLKIAKYLREYLEQYKDVMVYLTHEGIQSGELTVFDRAIIARDKKADLLVSLHINSSTSSEANGAEVYVTANTSLEKYHKKTAELAQRIIDRLGKLGIASRGVQTKVLSTDTTDRYSDGTMADYYGIIRYAMRGTKIDWGVIWPEGKTPANIQNGEGVPAILVEHCFISSSKDRVYLDSKEDIKKLAKADAEAIAEQYSLTLKTQETKVQFQKDDKKMMIKTVPDITPEDLAKQLKITNYSISNAEGKVLEKKEEKIATGYKITLKDKNYTLVKIGDVNGDGKVLASDALAILKHSVRKKELEGIYLEAADVEEDGKVLATDALAVLKYSVGKYKIEI